VCEVAGTDFQLAEYQGEPAAIQPTRARLSRQADENLAGTAVPLLLCATCDEVFSPRFYRRCQCCGYDFIQGTDPAFSDFSDATPRTMFVTVSVSLVFASLLFYFWLVLRS
jgi:hypothetical protein